MASSVKTKPAEKPKDKSKEEIVAGFQDLRQQQRSMATKISELQMDIKEHELVIETLKDVIGERKCFRLVGGVLVERTVADVLPALIANQTQMNKLVDTLGNQLEVKGTEINQYREVHNIHIRGENDTSDAGRTEINKKQTSSGVLVAQDT